MKRILLLFVVVSFFLSSDILYAQPAIQILKEQYLKLRNNDAQAERISEWQNLAEKFIQLTKKDKSDAATALNHAAILYEQLYKFHQDEKYLDRAEELLQQIASEYKTSDIADDALWRLADIQYRYKNKPKDAELLLHRIVKEFPASDMHDAALIRLKQLEGGAIEQVERRLPGNNTFGKKVVVIDAGHGAEDLGAVSSSGLLEKDVVLAIALELEKLLLKENKYVVKLTRRSDIFVPLSERTAYANENKADIFVSIHVNSSVSSEAHGLEVYYLDNTNDQASIKMAERENASVNYEGSAADLYLMLSDMIQSAKLDNSIKLAKTLSAVTFQSLKGNWQGLANRGVLKAPFYVLVGSHAPCALVELFFISNPQEGVNLGKEEFRHDLAVGLKKAIDQFLEKK